MHKGMWNGQKRTESDVHFLLFKMWEDIMPFYKNMKENGVILWRTA